MTALRRAVAVSLLAITAVACSPKPSSRPPPVTPPPYPDVVTSPPTTAYVNKFVEDPGLPAASVTGAIAIGFIPPCQNKMPVPGSAVRDSYVAPGMVRDYLVPIELGGSTGAANVWEESTTGPVVEIKKSDLSTVAVSYSAGVKDQVEVAALRAVCNNDTPRDMATALATMQWYFETNWVELGRVLGVINDGPNN
jgi:hypothetical protein